MRQGIRKHFFNESYFEVIDTEEKAYWLGFISADGCVTKASQYNSYRLQISLSEIDSYHIQKFLNCIDANDINIKTIDSTGFSQGTPGKRTSQVSLNSYKLYKDLCKYNVHTNKTYDIELPDLSDEMMNHYLRGFFDGDASYHYHYDMKSNRYRYSFEVVGASLKMMEQIRDYLNSKNITTHIYTRKSKHSDNQMIRLMSGSRKEMLKIFDLLYSDSHIYLNRKYDKINEIKTIAV